MKKLLLLSLLSALLISGANATQSDAASQCQTNWGSQTKSLVTNGNIQTVQNIRAGQHDCFDRLVFDTSGSQLGYHVQYVNNVYTQGAGELVPLSGGAKLSITANVPSYNPATGNPTYKAIVKKALPNVSLANYQTFKDAKYAGSFEGQTTVGLSVRAQLPFRVFESNNKLIIDVAHNW